MGAVLGGPYNTPPNRGTLVDTMVLIYGKGGSAVWDSEKGSCSEALGGAAGQNQEWWRQRVRAKKAQQFGNPKRFPVQRLWVGQLDRTKSGGGRELEQRRLSSLGIQTGFLFRGCGWDSWTEPREMEVEEMGQPSLCKLFEGNPEEGSFVRGTEGHERKALGMRFFLMGAQLGRLEWGPLTGTLRYG